MTQEGGKGIFRYIIAGLVVALLAPYAGCHIFTSPPTTHEGESRMERPSQLDSKKASSTAEELRLPEPSKAETDTAASLDDIEALLGKKTTER